MDLLDRYLQAVRFLLPRRQQDDIVRELSENLVSQIEDREAELGRALREEEVTGILRRHGHPVIVAGRYRGRQHLIGPAFFPVYLFTLQVSIGVALIVTGLEAGGAAIVSDDPVRRLVAGFLAFPGRALTVFAWTTLGFAALDFAQARLELRGGWDPRTLPAVIRTEDRVSRGRATFELLVSAGALVWLLLLHLAPHLMAGQTADFLRQAPVWGVVYLPILAVLAAGVLVSVTDLVRPHWTPARACTRIAIQAAALAVVVIILRAGEPWVTGRPGAALPPGMDTDQMLNVLNLGVRIGLLLAGLTSVVEIGRQIVRLLWRHPSVSAERDPARATR